MSSPPPSFPPGWYPDPAAPGAMRWWDGYRWGPPAAAPMQVWQPPRALTVDIDAEASSARYARATALVNALMFGLAAVSVLAGVRVFADFFDAFLGTGGDGPTPDDAERTGTLINVILGLGQIAVVVGLGGVVVIMVWLHRAARNARLLGIPARFSPGAAVGLSFVPVLNLWVPFQAVRDLFPPGHAARGTAVGWWVPFVAAGTLSWVTVFSLSVPVPVAWGITAVAVGFFIVSGLVLQRLIDEALEVHRELARAASSEAPGAGAWR